MSGYGHKTTNFHTSVCTPLTDCCMVNSWWGRMYIKSDTKLLCLKSSLSTSYHKDLRIPSAAHRQKLLPSLHVLVLAILSANMFNWHIFWEKCSEKNLSYCILLHIWCLSAVCTVMFITSVSLLEKYRCQGMTGGRYSVDLHVFLDLFTRTGVGWTASMETHMYLLCNKGLCRVIPFYKCYVYIIITEGCSHGQLACPNGKCIMAEWWCDGRSECDDGWDEFNCSKFTLGVDSCPSY